VTSLRQSINFANAVPLLFFSNKRLFVMAIGWVFLPVSMLGQAAPVRVGPDSPANLAFRNAVTLPRGNVSTPVFKLSKDYPTSVPKVCVECEWLKIPVKFQADVNSSGDGKAIHSPVWHKDHWDDYMRAIFAYVKEGQDPNLEDKVGWRTLVKGKPRWFNVPWMAYDLTAGREYVHGTTNERTARLADLRGPEPQVQTPHVQMFMADVTDACKKEWWRGFETWSVGYYNEYGGYALGRTFPPDGVPRLSNYLGSPIPAGLPFPDGTLVVKILTTNAPSSCVPYLKGAPQWQIDRHKYGPKDGYSCDREVQWDSVVQVDVAVVDSRSPTRWVYGTFAFDGNLTGDTFWDKLVPVGLQWGSDPWTFPAVPKAESQPLQQTVLNTDVNTFQHLGCGYRLAGPVDNFQSSCTSCHASAYSAPQGAPSIMGTNVPPSFGFPGMCESFSLDNAAYFQNQVVPQHFPGGRFPDAFTMDTSLQLEVAFTQYGYYNTTHNPQECDDPNQIKPAAESAQQIVDGKAVLDRKRALAKRNAVK
jgi:hypothetical protein